MRLWQLQLRETGSCPIDVLLQNIYYNVQQNFSIMVYHSNIYCLPSCLLVPWFSHDSRLKIDYITVPTLYMVFLEGINLKPLISLTDSA